MDEDSWPEVDLWGQPGKAPPDPRGRKRHRRLPQIAETIAVLRSADVSVETIALRVGISEPTLRKYYLRELEKGAELARATAIERQYKLGMDGNAASLEKFLKRTEQGLAAPPTRRKPKAEPLGKKAEAELQALTAHEDSDWGDLLH